MCGMRADPIRFEHSLGISVVGGDETDAALLLDCVHDPAETGVRHLDGFHHGGDHSCVADHVRDSRG